MATYKQYTTNNGTLWAVRGYLGVNPLTGKKVETHRKGFKTKKEAQHYYTNAKLQFDLGEHVQDAPKEMTFNELYQEWLKIYTLDVQESTILRTTHMFKNHILPYFGKYYISKISVQQVQNAIHDWRKKLQKYKTVFNAFDRVMKYAYKLQYIKKNPCEFVILPKKIIKPSTKESLDFYTKEQLHDLMKCFEQQDTRKWEALFRILAFTGLRRGEALGLTWHDINFKKQELSVTKSLKQGDKKQYIGETKTASSIRVVQFDDKTASVLRKWKAEQAKVLLALGFNALNSDQVIFNRHTNNKVMNLTAPRKMLVEVCEANELPLINVHGFRHTHCSLLFEAGVPMKDVKERLGHSDIKTTMNIYTHVTESSKSKSAQLFAKYVNF